MKRPRIGILTKSGSPHSGPGRYVRSLIRAMGTDEFEVVVFGPGPGARDDEPGPVRMVRLGEPAPTRPARVPAGRARDWLRERTPFPLSYWMGFQRETRRLADVLRRCPVDLLHTNETGCEESAPAARLAGVPVIVGTLHVLPDVDVEAQRRRWIHQRLTRRAVHALDRAIAVSDAGRTAWMAHAGLPPDRIVTIHNGIDPMEFRRRRTTSEARRALGIPAGDSSVVIGALSRLSRVKGLEYVIDAAALLRAQHLNVRVVIAGDGELLEDLRRHAVRVGAAPCVHFVGHRADVTGALEAFDVFALPSLSEALPYAVIEAMSMELPVVASDVGGVPEIVANNRTGFLVPPRNAESLAAALRPLVESSALRTRIGLAGRQRVIECFDQRRMAQRTVDLYRSLLGKARLCA